MGRIPVRCWGSGHKIRSVDPFPAQYFFRLIPVFLTLSKRMNTVIQYLKGRFLPQHKRIQLVFLFILSYCFSTPASSQLYSGYEENFAYEVKQIDEFFERFNNDSTLIKDYISRSYEGMEVGREDLLVSLFDLKSSHFDKNEVKNFIRTVNDSLKPVRLSFYDDDWYARVKCAVVYEGKKQELYMLLRVQKEKNGASKWVVHNVYADFLNTPNGNNPRAFLNPVSHATDFMGLTRAFEDPENLKGYLTSSFEDDHLSKFAIEMKNNRITFQQVENISYHFFQVDGWVFTVENFQRQEKNSGWLISRLIQANAKEKEEYKEYLLRQKI